MHITKGIHSNLFLTSPNRNHVLDSKRLLQRNRNVQTVLESKQSVESQRIFLDIKKNLMNNVLLVAQGSQSNTHRNTGRGPGATTGGSNQGQGYQNSNHISNRLPSNMEDNEGFDNQSYFAEGGYQQEDFSKNNEGYYNDDGEKDDEVDPLFYQGNNNPIKNN
jgi:hypothetical protein